MKPEQITAIADIILKLEQVGLEIAGGLKALIAMLHPIRTDAELDATVDAVVADATRRRNELAAGLPAKVD